MHPTGAWVVGIMRNKRLLVKFVVSCLVGLAAITLSSILCVIIANMLGISVEPEGALRAIYFFTEKMSGVFNFLVGYFLVQRYQKELKKDSVVAKNDDLRFVYKHFRVPVSRKQEAKISALTDKRYIEEGASPQKQSANIEITDVYHYTRGESDWEPAIYGGLTICYIYHNDKMVAIGNAQCSTKDQFCYRIGRTIARGRALKKLAA